MRECFFPAPDVDGVYSLARRVAAAHGLELPSYEKFALEYFSPIPLPLVTENRSGRLWLDRYYIAAQTGEEPVYIYIAKHHISEEMFSWSTASGRRNTSIDIPDAVSLQFTVALLEMSGDIWIREGIPHPEIPWTPKRRLKTGGALPEL